MLKRLIIDLSFQANEDGEYDVLEDLLEESRKAIQDAIVIKEGTSGEERGFILVQDCFHDESPVGNCSPIERWETGRGQVL